MVAASVFVTNIAGCCEVRLARYLQPEPLKSRASLLPILLSKPRVDSGIRGAGGQQQRLQDRSFLT